MFFFYGIRFLGELTVFGRGRFEFILEVLSRGLGLYFGLFWVGVGRFRWSYRLVDMGLWKGWVELGVSDFSF